MTVVKSERKWFEAGVFSVPSIVSRTQNYVDVIQNDLDGILVSGPNEWYEALRRLIQDSAFRRRIGLNARMRILKEYSISTMAKNINAILNESTDLHTTNIKHLPWQESAKSANPEIEKTSKKTT